MLLDQEEGRTEGGENQLELKEVCMFVGLSAEIFSSTEARVEQADGGGGLEGVQAVEELGEQVNQQVFSLHFSPSPFFPCRQEDSWGNK